MSFFKFKLRDGFFVALFVAILISDMVSFMLNATLINAVEYITTLIIVVFIIIMSFWTKHLKHKLELAKLENMLETVKAKHMFMMSDQLSDIQKTLNKSKKTKTNKKNENKK